MFEVSGMSLRQLFLGDPRNLHAGADPTPLLLEGAGWRGAGVCRPSRPGCPAQCRPHAPRVHSSGVIHLHVAFHWGNAVNTSHRPKSLGAEQVQSVTLALHPPWGKGLRHMRINDTGTRAHHHFSEVGQSKELQPGLLALKGSLGSKPR